MKAIQIPITSGPAAGTMVTRVESNSGKLLGFIRVVAVEFPGAACCPSMFIAYQNRHCRYKLCHTLLEAYQFLGVSSNELDKSDLGEYPYAEHTPSSYWRENESDALSLLCGHIEQLNK